MIAKMDGSSTESGLVEDAMYAIPEVPVTAERKPWFNDKSSELPHPCKLCTQPQNQCAIWLITKHIAVARANLAPSRDKPQGSTEDDWAKNHSHQTVLQQHCDFFDRDGDGIIWPQDTFVGFYRLGVGFLFSAFAVLVIHINFSYPTSPGWLPDPYFRLFLKNVHRARHGSDTGTFDAEGRFIPSKFEEIFTKYADGRDYLTVQDLKNTLVGQRNINDPIGCCGFIFECAYNPLVGDGNDSILTDDDVRDRHVPHALA